MAYRRSIRRTRRTRRTGRRKRIVSKGSTALVTKSFLKKTLAKTVESKRNSNLTTLTSESETPYIVSHIGQYITPGVTDEGRIGNTIHLTGIAVKYVFNCQLSLSLIPSTRWPPVTLKMFLVQSKNNYTLPQGQWFKTIGSGDTTVYTELSDETINAGLLVLNTDGYTILGAKSIKLDPDVSQPLRQVTGSWSVKLRNKKMTFLSNSLIQNGNSQINPPIYLVYYFYTGYEATERDPVLQYGARFSTTTYYKDT